MFRASYRGTPVRVQTEICASDQDFTHLNLGGEGVVLSSCGSPFGIGTDLAGSIRIPAAYNGIFGLKPTRRK